MMSVQARASLKAPAMSAGSFTQVHNGLLQCKARNPGLGTRNRSAVPPIVHEVLRSTGKPLDAETRACMESRFGHDFSQVRVHTDAGAEQSAASLNARAYTVGQNIVFRPSQYDPHSARGQRLLAHELAHVVQTDLAGVRSDPSHITPANHASEVEARAASQPGAMPVFNAAPAGIALDANDHVMVMPPAEIKGLDPNVVRPPGGRIGSGKTDEETQKVLSGLEKAEGRATTWLQGHKQHIGDAIEQFKQDAEKQIEAIPFYPNVGDLMPPCIRALSQAFGVLFPEEEMFVIAAEFVAEMAHEEVKQDMEMEDVKAAAKEAMGDLKTKVINGVNRAMNDQINQLGTMLTNLAVTDKEVWNMLALGGPRQVEDVLIGRLHIPNPAKQSPYGAVLKALMVSFATWLEKEKYEHGMTKEEKMIAEMVPGAESFVEMHKRMKAAGVSAAAQAKKETAAYLKGE